MSDWHEDDPTFCSECGQEAEIGDNYCEVTELCSDCYEHIMGEPLP